jgi:hypothetical protein
MNSKGLFHAILAVGFLASGSLVAGNSVAEVQSWNNPKGIRDFTLYVNCCSGTPFHYNSKNPFLTEITMVKNSGGFVTIQGKITNPAPWRKTFRIRWEWKGSNGMMSSGPADEALTMITLAGKEQQVIQGTSTIPNPSAAILTFFQHAK